MKKSTNIDLEVEKEIQYEAQKCTIDLGDDVILGKSSNKLNKDLEIKRLSKQNKELLNDNEKLFEENLELTKSNNALFDENESLFEEREKLLNEREKVLERKKILKKVMFVLFNSFK